MFLNVSIKVLAIFRAFSLFITSLYFGSSDSSGESRFVAISFAVGNDLVSLAPSNVTSPYVKAVVSDTKGLLMTASVLSLPGEIVNPV
ncbi:MAG: hypothetical protein NEHIOOID_01071 [Holosporales bacterium]